MGCGSSKALVINAEDAITLTSLGRLPINVAHERGGSMAVKHGDALFVVGGCGLAIVDVSSPAQPKVLCDRVLTGVSSDGSGSRYDATVCIDDEGEYVFIAGRRGLSVVDVKDRTEPKQIGMYSFEGKKQSVVNALLDAGSRAPIPEQGTSYSRYNPNNEETYCYPGEAPAQPSPTTTTSCS